MPRKDSGASPAERVHPALLVGSLCALVATASDAGAAALGSEGRAPPAPPDLVAGPEATRQDERDAMVREQLEARDIRDARVLAAMREVPRHRFVAPSLAAYAYADGPLPIGAGQTISQPYIVAFMAQALELRGGERILEIGSGSGYAAAVLSRLGAEVYGIELEPELYVRSLATVDALGYRNVFLRLGDGFRGWPERAPFDAVVISCAAVEVPPPLWDQLAVGGRVVFPRGQPGGYQELVLVTKTPKGAQERQLLPVRFVPLRRP